MSFKNQIHKIIKLDHWITPDALDQLNIWCVFRANKYADVASAICKYTGAKVMRISVFPINEYAQNAVEKWEYNMDTPSSIHRAELTVSPSVCKKILRSSTPCKLAKMVPIYMAALVEHDFLTLYKAIKIDRKIITIRDIIATGEPFYWFTGVIYETRAQFKRAMSFRVTHHAAKMIQEYVEKNCAEYKSTTVPVSLLKMSNPDLNFAATQLLQDTCNGIKVLCGTIKTVTPDLVYTFLLSKNLIKY